MYGAMRQGLRDELDEIRKAGLFKAERVISTPQNASVRVGNEPEVLNFCANNYLGLADHPTLVAAAREALDRWGFGMASVRFICGTQEPHKELEAKLSSFLGTEDTILYSSCFDANAGLFETLLGAEDAVISDELNHASVIDGVRLCKAKRLRYKNRDMADLERAAEGVRGRPLPADRHRRRVLDGRLPRAAGRDLRPGRRARRAGDGRRLARGRLHRADRAGARRSCSACADRVDVVTGTLGKALGGASGGYTSGRAEIVAMLRQRSRPYLFSNSLAPSITSAALAALDLLDSSGELLERLRANTALFRSRMTEAGFDLLPGEHPIIPVMIGDAALAGRMADLLLEQGIYVIGFSYPVVPHGKARIRTQMSAAHSTDDVHRAVEAFVAARAKL